MRKQNFGHASACLVQQYINTDFDVVESVSNNLSVIDTVHSEIDSVKAVGGNISEVVQVANGMQQYQIVESLKLVRGQTQVIFVTVPTTASEYYISGQAVDGSRLVKSDDYSIVNPKEIRLVRSYPEGTEITAIQRITK